jgi:hypothetical protein
MYKVCTRVLLTVMLLAVSAVADAVPPRGPGKAPVPDEVRRQREASATLPTFGPGFAFQYRPCLEDQGKLTELKQRLAFIFRNPSGGAGPDVRSVCSIPGDMWHNIETVGVWLSPAPPGDTDAARTRALAQVNILRGKELFAWSVQSPFLEGIRARAWEAQDKRLNDLGMPDPHGKIHLRSLTFLLIQPDLARTEVRGFYDAGPNVDFVLRVDSKIKVVRGKLVAEGEPKLDMRTETYRWLLHFATGMLPSLGWPWEVMMSQREAAAKIPSFFILNNLGVLIVNSAPNQDMKENGRKNNFIHQRFEIRTMGITGGGKIFDQKRQPAVAIVGPRNFFASGASAKLSFTIKPTDLRATDQHPLQIQWTADGDVANPTSATTEITFTGFTAYRQYTRNVSVRVTDADNLAAETSITVYLLHERSGPPPVCHQKPWLPQCAPGESRPR